MSLATAFQEVFLVGRGGAVRQNPHVIQVSPVVTPINASYDQNILNGIQRNDSPPKYDEIGHFKNLESTIHLKPEGELVMPVLPGSYVPVNSDTKEETK